MCSEYNSSMGVLEHQLKRLLQVRSNSERKIARVRETILSRRQRRDALLKILTERTELAGNRPRELRQLDDQRAKIIAEIAAFSREISEARKAINTIELNQESEGHIVKVEEQNIEMTRPLVETLLTCREKLVEEFDQSQKSMWQHYNERFSREIENAQAVDQKRVEFLELLGQFRIDCTENSEIAFLWNKRKEWIKAAQQIGATDINEQIQHEIRAIEQEFELRYPGILSWKKPADKLKLDTCLYFTRLNGDQVLVLPFSRDTWQKIADKSASGLSAALRKFFYLLVRALKLDAGKLDVRSYKGQLILHTDPPVFESLRLRYPAGTEVEIACQELELLQCHVRLNGVSDLNPATVKEATNNGEMNASNGLRIDAGSKENGVLSDSTDMEFRK